MNIIQYSVIQAIIKGNFWETFDPYHICWEMLESGKASYESASESTLEILWKDCNHLPCDLNKGSLKAQGYQRHGPIRKIGNNFDVIYCEWEKCSQN